MTKFTGWHEFIESIDKSEITGIIHVGASFGQEVEYYSKLNVPIVYFEPLEKQYDRLCQKIEKYKNPETEQIAECLAAGNEDKDITFYESSKEGVSSSVLEPTGHYIYWKNRTFSPITCKQVQLDTYFKTHPMKYNILIADVQGYELQLLEGAKHILPDLKYMAFEVWTTPDIYRNAVSHDDLVNYLDSQGWEEIQFVHQWTHFGKSFFRKK